MKSQTELDKQIIESLNQGVNYIELNQKSMGEIKERLRIKKNGEMKTAEKITAFFQDFRFKINKPAATFCCIMMIAAMLYTFVQPVKVWAKEGLDKAVQIIYTVVKDEDGSYKAVQVPDNNDPSYSTQKEVTDDAVDFAFKAPPALENGFELISTHIQVPLTKEGEIIDTVPDSIEKCYSKTGSDCIIFLTCSSKSDLLLYAKDKTYDGDTRKNRREYALDKTSVYYYENAVPEYPLVEDPKDGRWTFDFTQKPTIKTEHIYAWEQEGVYYELSDLGRSTFNEVKKDMELVIKYQLEKNNK
jgi:hypothetical protein